MADKYKLSSMAQIELKTVIKPTNIMKRYLNIEENKDIYQEINSEI